MDILPQPNNSVPVAHTANVLTLSHGNTSWKPPSILDGTKHSVVRAVIYLGDIFAIDERGEFLPCVVRTPIIVKKIKQQRSRVIDIAVIHNSSQLAIVLENKVIIYNGSFREVYKGRCSAIYPGYSHAYLKTPTGYKFYGSNVSAFNSDQHKIDVWTVWKQNNYHNNVHRYEALGHFTN
jgi:hypothetical protein